jgi:hypothetical protein
LQGIALSSVVAVVACGVRFHCLTWSAASRANNGKFAPFKGMLCRWRRRNIWSIFDDFTCSYMLATMRRIGERTAVCFSPSRG